MEKHVIRLVAELGKLLGCSDFTLDEHNQAIISCDGLLVQLSVRDDTQIRLSSWIGTMPLDADQEHVASALLSANHFFQLTNDATLAFDPLKNHIWLHQNLSIAGIDADRAFAGMERFVETAANWFDRLNPSEADLGEGRAAHPEAPAGTHPIFA